MCFRRNQQAKRSQSVLCRSAAVAHHCDPYALSAYQRDHSSLGQRARVKDLSSEIRGSQEHRSSKIPPRLEIDLEVLIGLRLELLMLQDFPLSSVLGKV